MSQDTTANRRIVLDARPRGAPTAADLRIENDPVPQPEAGQSLLRTLVLSLDRCRRGRMSDGPSYTAPVAIGDVMVGGTVLRVGASRHGDFNVGDLVLGYTGWRDYVVSDGKGLTALHPGDHHPSRALGVLGMPGFTAYMGLLDIGRPAPGETVVVAAASGAAGSVEDVGGAVFDAVLPPVNAKARILVCGLIADYNATGLPQGPDRLGLLAGELLRKRVKMEGFIVFDDYGPRWSEFAAAMGEWVQADKVKVRVDIVPGLENAPEAFIGLLQGKDFGKLVTQVARE